MEDQQLNASGESPTNACATFLAENDADCPNCGYNLRGVKSGTCPECAHALVLRELRKRVPMYRRWLAPGIVITGVIVLMPMTLKVVDVIGKPANPWPSLVLVIVALGLGIPMLNWMSNRRQDWVLWRASETEAWLRWAPHMFIVMTGVAGLQLVWAAIEFGYMPRYRGDLVDFLVEMSTNVAAFVNMFATMTCYIALCAAKSRERVGVWVFRSVCTCLATLVVQTWVLQLRPLFW